jgi:hypothetical protein
VKQKVEVPVISTVVLPNPDYSVTIGGIEVTPDEMRKEVGREIGQRKTAYPKFIKNGIITEEQAKERFIRLDAMYWLIKAIANGSVKPPVQTADGSAAAGTAPAGRHCHAATVKLPGPVPGSA